MREHIKNFNLEKLQEAFKIKEAYTQGEIPLDLANAQMRAHVGSLTPAELAYIEQHFEEKVDDECIKEDLEQMLAIYDGVLLEEEEDLPSGHPIRNYCEENKAVRQLISEIEDLFNRPYIKNQWDEKLADLNQFKLHLSRKQNQLYSELEKKGFDRPTTTMWLYDNEIRDRISNLTELTSREFDYAEVKPVFMDFKDHILDLMDKEENILYPTSLELLNDQIFRQMISGDREIGYCLIEPGQEYEGDFAGRDLAEAGGRSGNFEADLIELLAKHNLSAGWNPDTPLEVKQGLLSLNQINLVFQHLPVDISYVDENDLVAFYSDTKHRVFPRSKGVIGRHVKNCHPSNSVAIVEEIISKFRQGKEDSVEFWINKPGVFIYIKYVAVRDDQGRFRGVMEMMQDCTRIRSLEGSQTLLDWGHDQDQEHDQDQDQDQDKPIDEGKITELKPKTKISDLFAQYPGLKDYAISRSDKFSMLNSPMGKFMLKIATVEMVTERTGFSLDLLQAEFKKYLDSL